MDENCGVAPFWTARIPQKVIPQIYTAIMTGGGSINGESPIAGWFIGMENPIEMDEN